MNIELELDEKEMADLKKRGIIILFERDFFPDGDCLKVVLSKDRDPLKLRWKI